MAEARARAGYGLRNMLAMDIRFFRFRVVLILHLSLGFGPRRLVIQRQA